MSNDAVLFPVKSPPYPDRQSRLDTDDPIYLPGDPFLYLTLALAYDALAAPSCSEDKQGFSGPDYTRMQPRLAQKWTEDTEGNWTVDLRPDARSQHGNKLAAEDLVWRFERSFNQATTLGSWRWRAVVGLERAIALDEHTVRFELRAPMPTFPNWLISVTPSVVDSRIIRQHATADDPWGSRWLANNVAGFGPYDLSSLAPGSLSFRARSDYWGQSPAAQTVEVMAVGTRAEAIEQLNQARPVVVVGPQPDEVVPLLTRDDLRVVRTWAGHTSVEIDFTAKPFDDIRVRQALAYATPYREVIERGKLGQGRPWRSPMKGTSQWYTDADWHYDTNVDKAHELLKTAGYGSGIRSDMYVPSRADCVRIGEILQRAWRAIGVDLDLKPVEGTPEGWLPPLSVRTECAHNLSEPIYDLAHDYAVMDPILPPPGGPNGVGTWNPAWVRNETFLGDYRDLLLERDPARKKPRLLDLARMAVEFSSTIFLAEDSHATVLNRHVPAAFFAPDQRVFHALQYQNGTSNYLPFEPVALP